MPGQIPSFVSESLWQTPDACTRMRVWPGPGSGISRSTIWYGPLALTTWAARILGIDPPTHMVTLTSSSVPTWASVAQLAEAAAIEVLDRLIDLVDAVHDERPVMHERLVDGRSTQEHDDGLRQGLD